jgi:hypothetical protein
MKVKTVVENDQGVFEFQAELSEQQHAFLIEYALRDLIRKGLLPLVNEEAGTDQTAKEPTDKTLN